jgi:transposase
MKASTVLEAIIGTDKRNPLFTIYRQLEKKEIHVYYGAALLEILPDDRDSAQIKHLVGRLYNAGVSAKRLTEVFNYSFHTIQRWGHAIQTGDMPTIIRCFDGQGAPRKLTKEIESYIRHRFPNIYNKSKRDYSQQLRTEIKEVFQIDISSETLRPLFGELKTAYLKEQANKAAEKKTSFSK